MAISVRKACPWRPIIFHEPETQGIAGAATAVGRKIWLQSDLSAVG